MRSIRLLVLCAFVFAESAVAQIFVAPRRPSQSNVHYYKFRWLHTDVLVGPKATLRQSWETGPRQHQGPLELSAPWGLRDGPPPGGGSARPLPSGAKLPPTIGGVRLYFYEAERAVAERAAPLIERSYKRLVRDFDFVPPKTFPYFLYSSYQEFTSTNLFPVQEGVLGITNPRNLEMTLPFFGDARLFERVSHHELVHQFTVQKVRAIARDAGLTGDPLQRMPLWFIEGIAELYSLGGMDAEADAVVRDLVANPDPRQGYFMLGFFEDRPWSTIWTYKVGQIRCAFLEEVYGEGTIQRIIDESPLLVGALGAHGRLVGFTGLVQLVTGEEPKAIAARFEDWVKRRSYRAFLAARQADFVPVGQPRGRLQELATSPTGNLLMYRAIDPDTGQRRLYLYDRRKPDDHEKVVEDGVPGVESLHPVAARNFDLTEDMLAFAAQVGERDRVYFRPIERKGLAISLGRRTGVDLGKRGVLGVESLALHAAGRRVALIGVDEAGQKDVYVLSRENGSAKLIRLTNDVFAERAVTWGPSGVVYTSDDTSHGRFNLFRVDPGTGERERLTFEERDEMEPRALPDGRILFGAYDRTGANLFQVVDRGIVRLTDVATGLYDVGPGPDGSLHALLLKSGDRIPVRLDGPLLSEPLDVPLTGELAPPPATQPLTASVPYSPRRAANWEIGNLFGIAGASSSGLVGEFVGTATDRLRNHAIILTILAFGRMDLIDVQGFYINQEHRTIWGLGAFHEIRFRFDRTFESDPAVDRFASHERFFGGAAILRYPLSRFLFVQTDVAIGGVDYFLTEFNEDFLASPVSNGSGRDLRDVWESQNDRVRFQSEVSLSLGYNSIRYHRTSGPIAGMSALIEGTAATQPFDDVLYGNVRVDTERYLPVAGGTKLLLRGGGAVTLGHRLARQFYLYSPSTLRAAVLGDLEFLLGRHYFFSSIELQVPLFAIGPVFDVMGVGGFDFGGTGDSARDLWDHRVLDGALGVNFGFGPFVLRLHFAKPFPIGVPMPHDGKWTTSFSLIGRYQ